MLKKSLKNALQIYLPSGKRSVVVFASPRGGSTWLAEIIGCLPTFWILHEPFNLRRAFVKRETGIDNFGSLYDSDNLARIKLYYSSILRGRYPELKMRPWDRGYRFVVRRIVLKQNQALLNRISWFCDEFGVLAIHLVRHPIAVSLSRKELPLLQDFHTCGLRLYFTDEQLRLADSIIKSGDRIEKGVLAWCLHHCPALYAHDSRVLLLSYEHLVMETETVARNVFKFIGEESLNAFRLRGLLKASSVVGKSAPSTRDLIKGYERNKLVCKWREQITSTQEMDLLSILATFETNLYRHGEDVPCLWRGCSLNGN